MTKTERAVDATAAAVRSVAAGAAESRRARASRYATVAKMAAAAAGIGGAAEAVDAAIISGTTAVVLTSSGLGTTYNALVAIGDPIMVTSAGVAGLFQGLMSQGTFGYSVRYGGISAPYAGGGVHLNLLNANDVVDGNLFFGLRVINRSQGPAGGSVAEVTGVPVVIGTSNSVRGFVGFRFDNGGTDNFGYFDVEWSRDGVGQGSTLTVTIHGWAYDNSGVAITIGGATPIPGGTGLAALAIGAVGLRGRRRSRN